MTEQSNNKFIKEKSDSETETKKKLTKGQKNIEKSGVEELSKANFSLLLNTDGLDKESFFKANKKPFINRPN